MAVLTRMIAFTHRWIGIPVSLMAIVWFLSAFVMMYAGGMPRITPQSRLDHLPELDMAKVRIGPAEAAAHAGLEASAAGAPVLVTVEDRPVWRFVDAPPVFADDGALLDPLTVESAAVVALRFLRDPPGMLRHVGTVANPDQWTLTLRRALPLEKFAADDAAGTQIYVSPVSGEVVQATTRRERVLAWLGTIPHWLYFNGLRQNQPLWYRIVVTLSSLVCVLTVLGLVLAAVRWKKTRPFQWSRAIPFRGGMRWHYVVGGLFGLFIFTWAFSGLVSMEPWDWTNVQELEVDAAALTGGDVELQRFDIAQLSSLTALAKPRFVKEVTLQRIHGDHYWSVRTSAHEDARALPLERLHAPYDVGTRGQDGSLLVNAATGLRRDSSFRDDEILARLRPALHGLEVVEARRLTEYDDYYYSRSGQTPLPVLRVKLADPLATWLYIDVRNSSIVANVHRFSRVERWLYSGLHSLDFHFWYAKRPLWDLVMLLLLTGGLATSVLGFWLGLRRLLHRA